VIQIASIDRGAAESSDVCLGNVMAESIDKLAKHAATLADAFAQAGKAAKQELQHNEPGE